jgi:L-seryl-tRNA(Ser) seleniumtransferase
MLPFDSQARRAIPAVDALLKVRSFELLILSFGRTQVLACLRNLLAEQRDRLALARIPVAPDEDTLAAECRERLEKAARPSLRPVMNLTGTVLHTNLGRALLPAQAVAAAVQAMERAVNLEYDLGEAGRGERDDHVEARLVQLTGAEAAVIVNNNAAAVYLALNALASGREVVVSRGELVEIGGSFRVPDIMASAGCFLREVGTTNRTHPRDFETAIDVGRTAALMKVHASNYEIRGFTAEVSAVEMARIAHANSLPLIQDLGSGTLVDLEQFGLPHERTPREVLTGGADVVTFSGDKLLGGPQCGIAVGKRELIDRLRRHPMKRALRLDKVRLAALEAVLTLYDDPRSLDRHLPTLRLLTRRKEAIHAQAQRLCGAVQAATSPVARVEVCECASQIGSGALPVDTLPSAALRLTPSRPRGRAVEALAAAFRALPIPVIGRLHEGALWLDLRCLNEEQEPELTGQLVHLDLMKDDA